MTTADLARIISQCEANPSGPVVVSVQDMVALCRLALATHADEITENELWQTARAERRAALAAVFEVEP